jgi:ribosomal protein L19E
MMSFIIRYVAIILIVTTNTVYTQNQSKLKISRCSSCPDIKKLYDNSVIIEKNSSNKDNIKTVKNKILYTPINDNYKFILNNKKAKIQYLKERERCNLR